MICNCENRCTECGGHEGCCVCIPLIKEVYEVVSTLKRDCYLPGETWYIKYPSGHCLVKTTIISSTEKTVELSYDAIVKGETWRWEWEDIKFVEKVKENE